MKVRHEYMKSNLTVQKSLQILGQVKISEM